MKLLVFVSKTTGLKMLETLVAIPDDLLIVVGKRDSQQIQDKARSLGLKHLQIEAFRHQDFNPFSFDWLINLWADHIFNSEELCLAKSTLNVHPSYLPYSKGSDPVLWSQIENLPQGATLHEMTPEVDGGRIYIQEEIEVPKLARGYEIYDAVIARCVALFQEAWPDIRSGKIKPHFTTIRSRKSPNLRKLMLENKVRHYENLETIQKEFLTWMLAYNYGSDFLPRLKVGNSEFDIYLELRKSKS